MADDIETARAALHLYIGLADASSERITLAGITQLRRWDQWWSIEQVRLGNWSLGPDHR